MPPEPGEAGGPLVTLGSGYARGMTRTRTPLRYRGVSDETIDQKLRPVAKLLRPLGRVLLRWLNWLN